MCMTYSDMTVEGSLFHLTMATVVTGDTDVWWLCMLKRIHYLADNASQQGPADASLVSVYVGLWGLLFFFNIQQPKQSLIAEHVTVAHGCIS